MPLSWHGLKMFQLVNVLFDCNIETYSNYKPIAGGATGFDFQGYHGTIEPVKGSAAFWIDLTTQGWRDYRSSHGGCPILKGSKWILNKWINFFAQWDTKPCSLRRPSTMEPFSGVLKSSQ